MSVETKDILLKAAEDVQSGMWCKDAWFQDANVEQYDAWSAVASGELFAEALHSPRCAEGSIAVATRLLGGSKKDMERASLEANAYALEHHNNSLIGFNDEDLPDDPFEAGQQLAELFRKTAEEL